MPKVILLVDDSPDDIFMTKMACERSGLPHSLQVVRDGMEAVQYLSGEGQFCDRKQFPLPELVLLDINMPKMDGHGVLKWIRSQPQFVDLPVIMLTTSREAADLERAYTLGVNSYLRKDADLHEFGQLMRLTLKYWLFLHLRVPTQDE